MVCRKLADPRHHTEGQPNLNPDIRQFLKDCKSKDPAPRPQLVVPSSLIFYIAATFASATDPALRMTAHLIVMAFFFLLWVGKYTPSSDDRQTVPLRKKDIRMWRGDSVLDNDADLMTLLLADAVTICLETQMTGDRLGTVHHESSGDATLDPVQSVTHILFAIQGMPDTTTLGTFKFNGRVCQVRAKTILAMV